MRNSINMHLVSWNVAHRTSKTPQQCDYFLSKSPDVIALQEVTPKYLDRVEPLLSEMGYTGIASSLHSQKGLPLNRSYGVLIASKLPMKVGVQIDLPWSEKSLTVTINPGEEEVNLTTGYIPPGSTNVWAKIDNIEALVAGLRSTRTILCGDFNCPQAELSDGTIVTWGQRIKSDGRIKQKRRLRGGDGLRWDSAERSLFTDLADRGLVDVYRSLHGFGDAYSWVLRRKGSEVRRRFDHVFSDLSVSSCEYDHAPRLEGLSDHAALSVDFEISTPKISARVTPR